MVLSVIGQSNSKVTTVIIDIPHMCNIQIVKVQTVAMLLCTWSFVKYITAYVIAQMSECNNDGATGTVPQQSRKKVGTVTAASNCNGSNLYNRQYLWQWLHMYEVYNCKTNGIPII